MVGDAGWGEHEHGAVEVEEHEERSLYADATTVSLVVSTSSRKKGTEGGTWTLYEKSIVSEKAAFEDGMTTTPVWRRTESSRSQPESHVLDPYTFHATMSQSRYAVPDATRYESTYGTELASVNTA